MHKFNTSQRRRTHGFIAIFSVLFLASGLGCSKYFARKECEKINWFEYAEKRALSGQPLESDPFLDKCQKAEAQLSASEMDLGFKSGRAKYCEVSFAKLEAKHGRFYNYDFCNHSPGQRTQAQREFNLGLNEFCTHDSGALVGSSGWVYNQICASHKDKARFLDGYKKGRQRFLEAEIDRTQNEILKKERELFDSRRQIEWSRGELVGLQSDESRLQTLQNQASQFQVQNPGRPLPAHLDMGTLMARQSEFRDRRLDLQRRISDGERRVRQLNSEISSLSENRAKFIAEKNTLMDLR